MTGARVALADGTPLVEWLVERGLTTSTRGIDVSVLDGGVSSLVAVVRTASGNMVIKQPLDRLRVADEWRADTSRVMAEAAALGAMAAVSPGAAPGLLDVDEERRVIAIEYIAADGDWRRRLLDAGPDAHDLVIAQQLGEMLASWRTIDLAATQLRPLLEAGESFAELRTRPYHRTVAERIPDVADAMTALADELDVATSGPERSFVHGDYSPKNVLIRAGRGHACVLDFEVAHAGDAVFDLAFLTSHLICKSVKLDAGEHMARCVETFFAGYGRPDALADDDARLLRHTGGLLLARVHGRSPNAYLSIAERDQVDRVGRRMLDRSVTPTVPALFAAVSEQS